MPLWLVILLGGTGLYLALAHGSTGTTEWRDAEEEEEEEEDGGGRGPDRGGRGGDRDRGGRGGDRGGRGIAPGLSALLRRRRRGAR